MHQGLTLLPRPWDWSYRQLSRQMLWGAFIGMLGGMLMGAGAGVWALLSPDMSHTLWLNMALGGGITPFLLTTWLYMVAIAVCGWQSRDGFMLFWGSCMLVALAGLHIGVWERFAATGWDPRVGVSLAGGGLMWLMGLSPRVIASMPDTLQHIYSQLLGDAFPDWYHQFVSQQIYQKGTPRIRELLEEEQHELLTDILQNFSAAQAARLDDRMLEELIRSPDPKLRAAALRLYGRRAPARQPKDS